MVNSDDPFMVPPVFIVNTTNNGHLSTNPFTNRSVHVSQVLVSHEANTCTCRARTADMPLMRLLVCRNFDPSRKLEDLESAGVLTDMIASGRYNPH